MTQKIYGILAISYILAAAAFIGTIEYNDAKKLEVYQQQFNREYRISVPNYGVTYWDIEE